MYDPYRSVNDGTRSLSPTKHTESLPITVGGCIGIEVRGTYRRVCFITVRAPSHVRNGTMDDLKDLSSGGTSLVLCLVLCELVEPLQDRLDVLLSFLHRFYCFVE